MRHVVTTLIGAWALYASSLNTFAAEVHDGVPQEIVRFGDLDLARTADAHELYRRIDRAARDVCETVSSGIAAMATRNRLCTEQAIAGAVAAVDSPFLTERYEQKTHRAILQPQQVGLNR
jgi:UrcA family protein